MVQIVLGRKRKLRKKDVSPKQEPGRLNRVMNKKCYKNSKSVFISLIYRSPVQIIRRCFGVFMPLGALLFLFERIF